MRWRHSLCPGATGNIAAYCQTLTRESRSGDRSKKTCQLPRWGIFSGGCGSQRLASPARPGFQEGFFSIPNRHRTATKHALLIRGDKARHRWQAEVEKVVLQARHLGGQHLKPFGRQKGQDDALGGDSVLSVVSTLRGRHIIWGFTVAHLENDVIGADAVWKGNWSQSTGEMKSNKNKPRVAVMYYGSVPEVTKRSVGLSPCGREKRSLSESEVSV